MHPGRARMRERRRKSGKSFCTGQKEGEEEKERETSYGWVGLGKEVFVCARMMELPIEQLHEKTMLRV